MKNLLTCILLFVALSAHGQFSIGSPFYVAAFHKSVGGAASTLDTGLTAYWTLNEASGTRADQGSGSQTLTDNNTVTSGTGKQGNAADFESGNTEYLSHADSATLSVGDIDFTFSCWVKMESKTGFNEGIICKDGVGDDDNDEYSLMFESTFDRFRFRVGNSAANGQVFADTIGSPTADGNTWYLIVCWHDATANTVNIQVNNGTADTASYSGGSFDGTAAFSIGTRTFNVNFLFDGLIDEVGFWKRTLTAGERTALYKAGAGITCCPFVE